MYNDKYIEAEIVLSKSLQIKSTVTDLNNFGVSLFQQKRYDEASKHFSLAHDLSSHENYSWFPYFNLGLCLAVLDKKEETEKIADYLLNCEYETVDLLEIAEIYFHSECYDKVVNLYEEWLKEYNLSSDDSIIYLYSLLQINRVEEAEKYYTHEINVFESGIEDIQDINSGDYEDAQEDLLNHLFTQKEDLESFKKEYLNLLNGNYPIVDLMPRIQHDCYLFGCYRHGNV